MTVGGMDAMATMQWLRAAKVIGREILRGFSSEFACGALVSVLVAATGLSWLITWGDDSSFVGAAVLIAAAGLVAGGRIPTGVFSGRDLAIAAALWAVLQPWLADLLSGLIRWTPLPLLATPVGRLALAMILAVPVWGISCLLWSQLAPRHVRSASKQGWAGPSLEFGLGLIAGTVAGSLGIALWIGPWATSALCLGIVIVLRVIPRTSLAKSQETPTTVPPNTSVPASDSLYVSAVAWLGGGLLVALIRLTGQVFPQGAYVPLVIGLGLVVGFCLERLLATRRVRLTSLATACLMLAACGSLALATLPGLVTTSFVMTARITWVPLLVGFRGMVLALEAVPVGFCLTRMAMSQPAAAAWVWAAGAAGIASTAILIPSVGAGTWIAGNVLILLAVGITRVAAAERQELGRHTVAMMASCAAVSLAVPFWIDHEQPSRMTKLGFSTSSFVAYRAGWDSSLLTSADDARMIAAEEGVRGPLTLWRSKGLELHLREAGVPRAVLSSDSELTPQAAPEVLQAVLPLVFAENPQRVLLLGASAGVPLSTCVQFPVQSMTCAESDAAVVRLIQGPVAREAGLDPLTDPRIQVISTPPQLMVMRDAAEYDVILSSPPPSSLMAGAASFTVDHYRHAAACLAPGGIFCQRFECVDFGAWPLLSVVAALQMAFSEVAVIEAGAGELLLLATQSPGQFVPEHLLSRMEAPHVRRILARCGLDWTSVLNLPAYDHATLLEICREGKARRNDASNAVLALNAPWELLRWGAKLTEVQKVLTAPRTTLMDAEGEQHANRSRKSRLLEWLGDDRVTPAILRRLSDVATQQQLVRDNPESHWWEYRKALRQELQKRARSLVQQVAHTVDGDNAPLHPDDARRKAYFVALGAAARAPKPTAEAVERIADYVQPYDPLVSYFAHEEMADLLARGQVSPSMELACRLHMVYFAPPGDGSVRPVTNAIEMLVSNPGLIEDSARRFDLLNGLVQTLRARWEARQGSSVLPPRRQIADADRTIVAIEKAMAAMEQWQPEAGIAATEWESRKQVIDRILLRPLRAHRTQLQAVATRSEARTQAAVNGMVPDQDESTR